MIEAVYRNSLKEKKGNELHYDEKSIFDEFRTFFFAGVDTTSTYLATTIFEIARNPEVEEKVRAEIEEHMQTDDYSYENIKKLAYLDNVQKEVTRFYGPVVGTFLRHVETDFYLKGILMTKGIYIRTFTIGVHYSEKYYKDPTAFRPERWEGECDNVPAFAIGGFSAGPRTCIGKHLAKLEAKIGLIKFMKRYERVEAEDAKFILRFLYQPKEVVVRLTKA